MNGIVFIYALCEPGTRTVRYIGKTNNLKQRLKKHLRQSVKHKTSLGDWLRGLSSPPSLVMLCETSEDGWQEEEIRYIKNARMLGMQLVNTTAGGEGVPHTPEMIEKQRVAKLGDKNPNFGKRASLETRAKQSASRTGEKNPNFGKKATPEKLAKMRAAATGKIPSIETRALIGAASKKAWANPVIAARILSAQAAGMSLAKANKKLTKPPV